MSAYIPGLVIQKNNSVFISSAGVSAQYNGTSEQVVGLGLLTEIPTPDGGASIDSDYWAIPVGEGIVTGFKYQPYNAADPITSVSPNVQAFKVFRIYSRLASDYWYVLGTVAEYITAYGGGSALPTTSSVLVAGYQTLCEFVDVAQTKYGIVLALPELLFPEDRYYPFGYFNGVAMPGTPTASGYLTVGTLLTFLNANWTNLGSPVTAIVWTVSADNLTLIGLETAGGGTDVFAGAVAAINPSL